MAERKKPKNTADETEQSVSALFREHFTKLATDLREFNERHRNASKRVNAGARRAHRPTF